MSQFTVYANKNAKTRKNFPYLIDIQSDLLDELQTTVVIPLCKVSQLHDQIIAKLCPLVEIGGGKFVTMSQQLAGIDRSQLGKEITNLSENRAQFIAAIDFMILGI
ncbi:CcdB family protein [candidate division KSB1 bacterium]|nr:CcdB family protein [candidate division KSB1 bacterium]